VLVAKLLAWIGGKHGLAGWREPSEYTSANTAGICSRNPFPTRGLLEPGIVLSDLGYHGKGVVELTTLQGKPVIPIEDYSL